MAGLARRSFPPGESAMLIGNVLRDKGAEVFTITETLSLEDAAKELHHRRVGCVVVVDLGGEVAGILSERDIVREVARFGPERLRDPVSAAMTRSVIWAEPDETVDAGLARMTDRRIRHLPVMVDGRLVGLVSIGDLVKRRIEAVEVEAASLRAYIASG
jgi:CBS domain-containing protein